MHRTYNIKSSFMLILSFVLVVFFSCLYFVKKHDFLNTDAIEVVIEFDNQSGANIAVKALLKGAEDSDFHEDLPFHFTQDVLRFKVNNNVDQFRVYLDSTAHLGLKNIAIYNAQGFLLPQVKLNINDMGLQNNQVFFNPKKGAYLESRKLVFQVGAYPPVLIIGLIITLVLVFSYLLIKYGKQSFQVSILDIVNTFFIFSIFAPHPYYNIFFSLALVLNILANIKRLEVKKFWPILAVATLYFGYLMGNDLLMNGNLRSNDSSFELYILFILIPIYIFSIKKHDFLRISSFVVVFVMLFMFATSLLNYLYHPSLYLFAFDVLSKYVHPVYFSYFIAIVLLSFKREEVQNNLPLVLFMLLSLVALGSKPILFFVLFWLLFSYKKFIWPLVLSLVLTVLFFQPAKNRFLEILNLNDLSILEESYVENPKDPRLNGLTLKLLIWEAAYQLPQNQQEIWWGIDSNQEVNQRMERALLNKGLVYQSHYSTHNEFLRIYLEMGLVGLALFLGWILSLGWIAIQQHNKTLLALLLLFLLTMCFESHQHRVLGVYLFLVYIYAAVKKIRFTPKRPSLS